MNKNSNIMPWLIFVILLILPSYLIRFSVFGIPSTLLEIFIYVIFIFGLYKAKKTEFKKIPWKIYLPIGLLLIALGVSTYLSPDKRTALGELKGFFIDPILVFWLIFQFMREKDIPKLFSGLILSGLFVASYTIFQKIYGQVTDDGRVVGVFGYSPNYVALYLAPISVLVVGYGFWFLLLKRYKLSVICLILFVINIISIYLSGSRGGFLAILSGIGLFFLYYYWGVIKRRISAKIIISIVILFGIYAAWSFLKPDLSAATDAGRIASSNNIRYLIWQATIELGKNHPIFGVGLGYFQEAFNLFTFDRINYSVYITPWAYTPHNIFLMFWLSTGILGLVSLIWLLVAFFMETIEKYKNLYTPIIFGSFASIILYGLIETSIWKNDLSVIFWTLWGLIWIL